MLEFNNFEAMVYPDRENVECKLEFSTSFADAVRLRNVFDNNRDMADAIAYGVSNCLSKPGARKSGRYSWGPDKAAHGYFYSFKPKKVIFNDPATIVLWKDGTKTIVKRREGEPDDKEKAVMYCILKKLCGSKADMDRYLKLFLKEEESNEEKEKAGSGKSDWKKPRAGSSSSEGNL